MSPHLEIDREKIAAFCEKWKVAELALFGSVLRDDFRPDSDVDVLVSFAEDAHWSLLDMVDMQDELQAMFAREIDLVEKGALKNPFRRAHILKHHQVIYAADGADIRTFSRIQSSLRDSLCGCHGTQH